MFSKRARIPFMVLVPVILSALSTPVQASEPTLFQAGTYLRTWGGFMELYHATFHSADVASVRAASGTNPGAKPEIAKVAEVLLRSQRVVPMTLTIRVLFDMRDWDREYKAMLATFIRAGIAVNAQWQVNGDASLSADVRRYVDAVLGADKDHPALPYRLRKNGDILKMSILGDGSALFEYLPQGRGPGDANYFQVRFQDPRVIRALISTYIDPARCSDELRAELPQALLKGYLDSRS